MMTNRIMRKHTSTFNPIEHYVKLNFIGTFKMRNNDRIAVMPMVQLEDHKVPED